GPALAGLHVLLALLVLGLVLLLGVGVKVTAGEDDLLAVGPEVGAGGLADAGADAAELAGVEIHDEDLVERVAGPLLLGLEDDPLAVGREVALAGANEILRHLSDVGEVGRLGLFPVGRVGAEGEAGEKGKHRVDSFSGGYLIAAGVR